VHDLDASTCPPAFVASVPAGQGSPMLLETHQMLASRLHLWDLPVERYPQGMSPGSVQWEGQNLQKGLYIQRQGHTGKCNQCSLPVDLQMPSSWFGPDGLANNGRVHVHVFHVLLCLSCRNCKTASRHSLTQADHVGGRGPEVYDDKRIKSSSIVNSHLHMNL